MAPRGSILATTKQSRSLRNRAGWSSAWNLTLLSARLQILLGEKIKMGRTPKKANCHPERKHYGKGLCRQCWMKGWTVNHPNYSAKWRSKNPDWYKPESRRAQNFKKKYGITVEEYNAIFKSQRGKCAICGRQPDGRWKRLFIDHKHASGKIRGLLCIRCNRAIGLIRDDPEIARGLVKY